MSDGPFKSSRLRKGWQDVGDRADNSNFASADIYDALASAVKTDFEQDVSPQLLTK